jgi:hypothetical protein
MCDESWMQNLKSRKDTKLLENALGAFFYENKNNFDARKDFIDSIVKTYYNGNRESIIQKPRVVQIERVDAYRIEECKNVSLNIIEKEKVVEAFKQKKMQEYEENLFKEMITDEETILRMFYDAYKDIIFEAFIIKFIYMDSLRFQIIELVSRFKKLIVKKIKTIHNCSYILVRILNLFFLLFGVCTDELIPSG